MTRRAQRPPRRSGPTVFNVGDEAQREKNGSQVETQTLRERNKAKSGQERDPRPLRSSVLQQTSPRLLEPPGAALLHTQRAQVKGHREQKCGRAWY